MWKTEISKTDGGNSGYRGWDHKGINMINDK